MSDAPESPASPAPARPASRLADEPLHSGELVADVEDLVRAESPTGDAAGIEEVHVGLRRLLAPVGAAVTTRHHDSGAHLIAHVDGAAAAPHARPVLLLGHADTVWPRGTVEAHGIRHDGVRLDAPGGYDMKAGLVIAVHALRLLRRAGVPHPPVVLLVTADEEIGTPTGRDLVQEHALRARAVLGFEPPHPDGALKTARLGSARVRLVVAGRAAHAALDPLAGVSAIEELIDQLHAVRALATAHPTALVNVGTVRGGGLTNMVPDRAHADLGLRTPDEATETSLLAGLRALAPVREGASVVVEVLSSRPAWSAESGGALLERVIGAAASVGQAVAGRPAAGAADTSLTGRLGVPTLDGFGPLGGGAHARHEHVLTDSLAPRVRLAAATIAALADD
ncbi:MULTISPECIES: M20/M25/M40 family metallo-hydrolase [unclassified Agromyces]|uniref:M20/M25/M40 family metallo-hydrolase n=1 Tax=unclassified Agromyces TaxID=2639701 RepID=UPI0030157CC0